ncbi:YchJ family protein [Aliikangiella sp. IMCC44632]
MLCYCGSQTDFSHCCQPLLQGKQLASNAEALMRSRFSAFRHNNAQYLVQTHWPVNPLSQQQIQRTIDTTHWLGLKVVNTEHVKADPNIAYVEFVAFYFEQGGVQQLHEKSRFKKREQHWYYLDGEALPPIKIGRNEACICGSTKKFKQCHGRTG